MGKFLVICIVCMSFQIILFITCGNKVSYVVVVMGSLGVE